MKCFLSKQDFAAAFVAAGSLLAAASPGWAQLSTAKADPKVEFRPAAGAYLLTYDVDLLGTHVVTLGVDLGLGHDAYDVSAQIKTVGFANWLLGWQQSITSQGKVAAGAVLPSQHRSVSEFRGRTRTAEIDYAEGRVAQLRVDPPPRSDGRDDVNERLRAGTSDPMSAILGLVYAANQGQGCAGRTPVFDGRRRYDLVTEALPPGQGEAAGIKATLACTVLFQRIAGERRPGTESAPKRQDPSDSARVWMGQVEALNVVAPMRIEFESAMGTMNLVLREARFRVDVAKGDRPRPSNSVTR